MFRKGIVLLGSEEMDGDYAGEDLRGGMYFFLSLQEMKKKIDTLLRYSKKKQPLEAMVERPPPCPLTDEFGLEILNSPKEMIEHSPTMTTTTTTDPSSTSNSTNHTHIPLASAANESQKLPTSTLPSTSRVRSLLRIRSLASFHLHLWRVTVHLPLLRKVVSRSCCLLLFFLREKTRTLLFFY